MITIVLALLVFTNSVLIFALSCEQIISEKRFFKEITLLELNNCLPLIGKSSLDITSAINLWDRIKNLYDGIENIPPTVFSNMGGVLVAIPVNDLKNLTMNNIEIVKAFGSNPDLDEKQMNTLVDKVKSEWANKTPERYSEFDLRALGQILCYFNKSDILSINPDAYKDAADAIGKLSNCPQEVIVSLAELSVQMKAFGNPIGWSKFDITAIGNVIKGLTPDQYRSIPLDLIETKRKYSNDAIFGTNNTIQLGVYVKTK